MAKKTSKRLKKRLRALKQLRREAVLVLVVLHSVASDVEHQYEHADSCSAPTTENSG
ncbi:hypothetical protein [Agaribacter flavus]|uniref:Uncharacterized protein n=1 Tax=Agaribacter flavus TaxID=1902781 RepID=A0ABV7FIC3_9ALTE